MKDKLLHVFAVLVLGIVLILLGNVFLDGLHARYVTLPDQERQRRDETNRQLGQIAASLDETNRQLKRLADNVEIISGQRGEWKLPTH